MRISAFIPSAALRARWRFPVNSVELMMPVSALLLLFAVIVGVIFARSWPLVHDAALIHYIVFLMHHGRAPYRDIADMNMPGAYMAEWIAIHILGGDAFGWRLWDLFLGVVTVCASAWVAGLGRRWAGIAAGSLAYLDHLADGAEHLGQRDWLVGVLFLLAFGCMFHAIRRVQPAWMAGCMIFFGFAASIKPPVVLFALCFFAATCWLARRRLGAGKVTIGSPLKYFLWGVGGSLVPCLAILAYLSYWGATRQFMEILHGLVPWYAGLQKLTVWTLLMDAIVLRPLVLGAFLLMLLGRTWRKWDITFLMAAALAGVAIFVIQGKGWQYHLYLEKIFFAIWAMSEIQHALFAGKLERTIATVVLVVTTFILAPRLLWFEHKNHYPLETITHLESDLVGLGGNRLSGRIQCLDMTMGGCINVLYRLKLVQSTGAIYDFYLFPQHANAVAEALQSRFLKEVVALPPQVIVLSSQTWPDSTSGYEQLHNWPAFESFLHTKYQLHLTFSEQRRSAGYRLYTLKEVTH